MDLTTGLGAEGPGNSCFIGVAGGRNGLSLIELEEERSQAKSSMSLTNALKPISKDVYRATGSTPGGTVGALQRPFAPSDFDINGDESLKRSSSGSSEV